MAMLEINSLIPNTMSHRGLEYLARIARALPANSTVIEAGSLYGCTAWVLSKNSDPTTRIYAIDPWESVEWIDSFVAERLYTPQLSESAFRAYTGDCPNVTPILGYAPGAAAGIDTETGAGLQLMFEDASHDYETTRDNLEYFYERLAPGGIICGDDYQRSYPGVIQAVDELAEKAGGRPEVGGQVWALRKPLPGDAGSVYSHIGPLYPYELAVELTTRDGQTLRSSPHCFTPNLHHPSEIASIRILWEQNADPSQLGLQWWARDSAGNEVGPLTADDTFFAPAGERLVGIRAAGTGPLSSSYRVGTQASIMRLAEGHPIDVGPTRERFGGWLEAEGTTGSIYALNVAVVDESVRESRQGHARMNRAAAAAAAVLNER